jgi:Na+-driven multidrug efflux pump
VTALGSAINSVVAATLYFAGPTIAQLMCGTFAVRGACESYFSTLWWTEPFLAIWLILSGAMQGAAYTRMPMCVTVFCFNIARSALIILGANAESQTAWNSMAFTSALAGIMMIVHWHRRQWQSAKI